MANMAEVMLGPLVEDLNSLIRREVRLVRRVKTDLRNLSRSLDTIRAVLADAEEQQIKSKGVQDWLMRLQDAAYDAQDILEDWAVADHEARRRFNAATRIIRVRQSFLSLLNLKRLLFRYKIAKRVKEIGERFDQIAKDKSDFHLKAGEVVDVDGMVNTHHTINPTSAYYSNESKIFGRDVDRESMVKILLGNRNIGQGIAVCPIVGIGGLGKTTLAQLVFNDHRIQKHFDVRIWICVSHDFNGLRLLKEIVEFVTKTRFDHDNLTMVQDKVKEVVRGKKFLLVLDDVWSDKPDNINMLKTPLSSGAEGSSIVVTTRLETVASITKAILEPYKLKSLSEIHCWSLFTSYAFVEKNELEKQNLTGIGEQIVRKCGGLPLAIKALGSLLCFKDEVKQWEQVRDNEIWDLEEEDEILPALRLSYYNLSPRARQCFAYCSFFPKNYEMSKEELVHLWLANGLLEAKKMELETVGGNVFRQLKLHSFFQDMEEYQNKITFKIHDLLHDLASSVMKNEHSRINNHDIQDDKIRPRHMSITMSPLLQSSSLKVADFFSFLSSHHCHLRTLFLFSNNNEGLRLSSHDVSFISGLTYIRALRIDRRSCILRELPPSFGKKLKHLRMLSLSKCDLSSLQAESFCGMRNLQFLDLSYNYRLTALPNSIGDLEKLRHLDLSQNACLKTLPESLGNLTELETLKLNDCDGLTLLPQNTSKLCSLKHLENERCIRLRGMPSGLGKHLTCLEKLSLWVWGIGESENIAELRALNLLSGSLKIRIRTSQTNDAEARDLHWKDEEDVLTNKINLSQLHISFRDRDHKGVGRMDEQVLRVLKPPSNIEHLEIWEYKGMRFPNWMQMRDPLSSFPRLRIITITSMYQVHEWWLNWREKESLPALQRLEISFCHSLKALPEALGNLTSLKSLKIFSCDALVSVPTALHELTSLESLQILCCYELMWLSQLQLMTSLKKLEIITCPKLKFMFDGLRHLTSLQKLCIKKCPGVVIPKEELETLVALRGSNIFQTHGG